MIPRPIIETDLKVGDRVAHRKGGLTGTVVSVDDPAYSVMVRWDLDGQEDNIDLDFQWADHLVRE
jgi:preprotein translocase subunit YajC